MNATATATRPRTRKPSAPIVPAKPFWYAPSLAARTAILEALAAALDHEFEDDERTSDAWRVAKAAHAPAEAIVVDGFPPPGESDLMFRNDIAASAFDVRAFLTAALNYPGQPFCADRSVHLVRAHRIADALAALNVAGPDQSMVAEVYATIKGTGSAVAVGTATDEPTGEFNDDQMHEVIAITKEATAIMQARSEAAGSEHLFAAQWAAERAIDALDSGLDRKCIRRCANASAPLGVACEVLNTTLAHFDDQALHGAWRLLELAKDQLDVAVNEALGVGP